MVLTIKMHSVCLRAPPTSLLSSVTEFQMAIFSKDVDSR
jgi:hypothetical protein